MNFEYEIPENESVAAYLLDWKLSGGRERFKWPLVWILAGLVFVAVAWSEGPTNLASIILAPLGAWWIYAGIANIFPAWHFRRFYRKSGLAGEKYKAELSEDGFEVSGDLCSWRVPWKGVRMKGEDKLVFMFAAANTIFIFGKKFLTDEQQQELRRLSGLVPSDSTEQNVVS